MTLELKPDFDRISARFEAWWHGQVLDRALVQVGVNPTRPYQGPVKQHGALRDRWMDVEYQVQRAAASLAMRDYLGDSFPSWMPNLGPEILGTLYGVELEFGEHTSWSKPIFHDRSEWAKLPLITPNFINAYWQILERMMDLGMTLGRGRFLVGIPDLHGAMDVLASLREPQELCIDVLEAPELVQTAGLHAARGFVQALDRCYRKLMVTGMPTTSWLPCLHQGPAYIPNCDFWCMLSPETGRDLVAPMTRIEMQPMARSIYHLDGPDVLRHLETVLALPGLHAVQWVYGAGRGPAARWLDVYRRCRQAGQSLQVLAEGPEDAMTVLQALGPEGLLLTVEGDFPDHASALGFIKDVASVTKKR